MMKWMKKHTHRWRESGTYEGKDGIVYKQHHCHCGRDREIELNGAGEQLRVTWYGAGITARGSDRR